MGKAFTLRNGLILLSTEAPGGIYNAAQLKKVSALCDENTAILKATEDQRLALFVKPENAEKVQAELKSVGLGVRNYQEGLHQPVNCIGNMCPENLQDALGTSMEVQKTLSDMELSTAVRIGINGCFKACVPTHTLDISLIGDTKGYRISLGGKNSQLPEMACFMAENVPANEVPGLLKQVLTIYKNHAQDDETLQEVMERVGTSEFVKALHPYSQDAAGADDPFGGFSGGDESADGSEELDFAEDDGTPTEEVDLSGTDTDEINLDDLPDVDAVSSTDEIALDDLEDVPAPELGASTDELSFDQLEEPAGAVDETLALDDLNLEETALESSTEDLSMESVEEDNLLSGDELQLDDSSLSAVSSADEELDLTSLGEPELIETSDDMEGISIEPEAVAADQELDLTDEVSFDALGNDTPLEDAPEELSLDGNLEISEETMIDDLGELDTAELDLAKDPEFESLSDEEVSMDPLVADDMPRDESGNALEADEVDESEADAFEEKLNASIDEEESMPSIDDENTESRLAAVRLVEAASVEDGDLSSDDAGEFGNLELDRDSPDFEDDVDHIDLAPEVFDESIDDSAPAGAGNDICGIDFLPDNKVSLRFDNGAKVTFSPSTIGADYREISVGGKSIGIRLSDDGVSIEVEGLSVFYPKIAA